MFLLALFNKRIYQFNLLLYLNWVSNSVFLDLFFVAAFRWFMLKFDCFLFFFFFLLIRLKSWLLLFMPRYNLKNVFINIRIRWRILNIVCLKWLFFVLQLVFLNVDYNLVMTIILWIILNLIKFLLFIYLVFLFNFLKIILNHFFVKLFTIYV